MPEDALLVADGNVVTIRYTLTVEDGSVVDQSGDEPLSYLHGADNIVPGLERELAGKKIGDKLTAVVAPEDGYGERDEDPPQRVPKAAFPPGVPLEVGMDFLTETPDGEVAPVWVVAVESESVLIDQNHPLAGETLTFDVEVVGIRSATSEEIDHGHPHGPDGHHH
jgi:FKBP-type peptidyl-prolyl cis-trans isomerase SlyD